MSLADRADTMEGKLNAVDEAVARQLREQEELLARLAVRVGRVEMLMDETQQLRQQVHALEMER